MVSEQRRKHGRICSYGMDQDDKKVEQKTKDEEEFIGKSQERQIVIEMMIRFVVMLYLVLR